ncbi:hypothetical protein [Paractinoplanes atraurantiacus]|uniref:Uncharacterized protein n=1 Tax=Paractinoplanes atraurantiacus TaxID=1036182 RepID=A0A285JYT8_9ACTN|nr:hypothetical protein [Actinoplanes atraurantiacus]SNY64446.1 hypothetical protein SAMN05421748_126140 [Actinoplanes atraurantiacus]
MTAALLPRPAPGPRVAVLGRRAIAVAVIAAVLGGLSGLALGSWLAWRAVPSKTPGEATAISLARTVLPGPFEERVEYYGRSTFWNPYSKNTLFGGTGVRAGRAGVTGTVPPDTDVAAAVQQQMRAHGWHDVSVTGSAATAEVTGTRDGHLAAVQIPSGAYDPPGLRLELMWAEPPGHVRDTVIGGLAGALSGALLGLFTAKRIRRYGPRRQRAYSWLCVATLLLLAPAGLGNIPTSTGSLLANTHRNGTGPSVYWGGFVIWGAEPLALLSVIPILAILALCFWPRGQAVR